MLRLGAENTGTKPAPEMIVRDTPKLPWDEQYLWTHCSPNVSYFLFNSNHSTPASSGASLGSEPWSWTNANALADGNIFREWAEVAKAIWHARVEYDPKRNFLRRFFSAWVEFKMFHSLHSRKIDCSVYSTIILFTSIFFLRVRGMLSMHMSLISLVKFWVHFIGI